MEVTITDSSNGEHASAVTVQVGNKSVFVSLTHRDGTVNVLCRNAMHRAHGGPGRFFNDFDAALDGYKSGAMKAAIETAREELAPAADTTESAGDDVFPYETGESSTPEAYETANDATAARHGRAEGATPKSDAQALRYLREVVAPLACALMAIFVSMLPPAAPDKARQEAAIATADPSPIRRDLTKAEADHADQVRRWWS